MKVVDSISRMATLARMMKKEGRTVGFVPTMGALHEGHLSLVRTAKKHTDVVVMSIFVNPTQFGPHEDFDAYPRDFKADEMLAMNAGVDVLFCPSAADMYPAGHAACVLVERLTESLCGLSRPGHFKGVSTVVAKLFNIVKPDVAYFGQKDIQQAIVIRKMAEDLNFDLEVKVLPTVREASGLAMSSRNAYLSAAERQDATALFESLRLAGEMIDNGERDPQLVVAAMRRMIEAKKTARVDYISIVDAGELRPVSTIAGEVVIALAVYIGKTRLIDNSVRKVS